MRGILVYLTTVTHLVNLDVYFCLAVTKGGLVSRGSSNPPGRLEEAGAGEEVGLVTRLLGDLRANITAASNSSPPHPVAQATHQPSSHPVTLSPGHSVTPSPGRQF